MQETAKRRSKPHSTGFGYVDDIINVELDKKS